MGLQVKDEVVIYDNKGDLFGEGVIVNINDFREPDMKYAVDVVGYSEDVLFFGDKHLKKKNSLQM